MVGRTGTMALLATGVVFTVLLVGGAVAFVRSPDPTPTREASDRPAPATQGTIVESTPDGEVVHGWPHTTANPPGEYSWDRHTCAGQYCVLGFMHNGYGSGDVEIFVESSSRPVQGDGATAVTVAGHDGLYRRDGDGTEEWTVGIQGTTVAIRLRPKPGASTADLAEARAIVDSMRTERRDTKLGFRLVFTLTTGVWDSG